MMKKKTIRSTSVAPIKLIQNMRYRELTVEFKLQTQSGWASSNPSPSVAGRTELFRFRVPFQQMQIINLIPAPANQLVLLMTLDTPPRFFKKLYGSHTHDPNGRSWHESDTWHRQTDVVNAPSVLKSSAVALKKSKPMLDLGTVVVALRYAQCR